MFLRNLKLISTIQLLSDFGYRKSHSLVEDTPSAPSTSMFNSSTLGRPRATGRPAQSSSFEQGYNTVPTKSKGMSLFLKQQEKLVQLGDDIQGRLATSCWHVCQVGQLSLPVCTATCSLYSLIPCAL